VTIDVPDKALGRDKFSRVHLWVVPASVHGLWCAEGASLEIVQRFQRFSATLSRPGSAAPAAVFDGRISATTLQAEGVHAVGLRLDGATLRVLAPIAAIDARAFERARSAVCP